MNASLLLSGPDVKARIGSGKEVRMAAIGMFVGILAMLGMLAVLGGNDSRDGEDWVRHVG